MTLKTSDLCDACDAAQACALPFRGFGQRTAFSGAIRTICCFEDIALMRNAVNQPGNGQVLVIDGGEDAIELLLLLKQQFRKVFVGGLGFHVPEIALSQTRSR